MKYRILQLQKRASGDFISIRDKYAVSKDGMTLALADGTTQSFEGGVWAEMLTQSFVENPEMEIPDLLKTLKDLVIKFERQPYEFNSIQALALLEKAKMQKGATSTFLAINIKNNKARIINCGDSNLFMLTKEGEFRSLLFKDLDALDSNNTFINTKAILEEKLDVAHFQTMEIDLREDCTLILATDALSRLLFKVSQSVIGLLNIRDFKSLHDFCIEHWESRSLQEDDISALIIELNKNSSPPVSIIPPHGFSFPKPEIIEFKPFVSTSNEINFTDMQFNDIMTQFSFVEKDFKKVKTQLNYQAILSLIVVLLLLLFLFFPRNSKSEIVKGKQQMDELKQKNAKIQSLEIELIELKQKLKNPPIKIEDTSKKAIKVTPKAKKSVGKKDPKVIEKKPMAIPSSEKKDSSKNSSLTPI